MSVPSLLNEVKDDKNKSNVYKWKTDLLASQKFWTGKFYNILRIDCFKDFDYNYFTIIS